MDNNIEINPGDRIIHLKLFWQVEVVHNNKIDIMRTDRRKSVHRVKGISLKQVEARPILHVIGYDDVKFK